MRTIWDRFWAKVEKQDGPDGCWLWTAAAQNGYGVFRVSSERHMKAHRWLYEALEGPVVEGLQLDHLCRVRNCVNPMHLEPVTARENVRRVPGGNATKTHCVHGHPLSGPNLMVQTDGRRKCRECSRQAVAVYDARVRRTGEGKGGHQKAKTHCPQGHPYDEVNTYVSNGRRKCRECKRQSNRDRKRLQRMGMK